MWRFDRPKEEGCYWCTLVADVGEGKTVAYGSNRMFKELKNVIEDYRMIGEPLVGLGWIRDADGYKNERVFAWSENEIMGVCKDLPKGTIVIKSINRIE